MYQVLFIVDCGGTEENDKKLLFLMDILAGEADNKILTIKNRIQFQVVISAIKKTKLRRENGYLRL